MVPKVAVIYKFDCIYFYISKDFIRFFCFFPQFIVNNLPFSFYFIQIRLLYFQRSIFKWSLCHDSHLWGHTPFSSFDQIAVLRMRNSTTLQYKWLYFEFDIIFFLQRLDDELQKSLVECTSLKTHSQVWDNFWQVKTL